LVGLLPSKIQSLPFRREFVSLPAVRDFCPESSGSEPHQTGILWLCSYEAYVAPQRSLFSWCPMDSRDLVGHHCPPCLCLLLFRAVPELAVPALGSTLVLVPVGRLAGAFAWATNRVRCLKAPKEADEEFLQASVGAIRLHSKPPLASRSRSR